MTISQYSRIFKQKAINAGYSEENIQYCLNYAEPLISKGLPIIYNTTNLAALVGYDKLYLKKAALYTNNFYRRFNIKKKDGSPRRIEEPLPSLKEIQIWILNNILYKIPVSRFAKAYIQKRGIIDNVKYHIGSKKILNLDISNFFSSINRDSVESIFLHAGYSSNLSNLFSKLCCLNDRLPQGAPTSPCLSNLFMQKFDLNISIYCKEKSIRFTRYADDMTFSGEFDEMLVVNFVTKELDKLNLSLNSAKTKVIKQNARQIVTGIVVNEKAQVPKIYRNKIRLEIYYLEKFGLAQHLEKINNNRDNYLEHLQGKIDYALFINRNDKDLIKYKTILQKYFKTKDE